MFAGDDDACPAMRRGWSQGCAAAASSQRGLTSSTGVRGTRLLSAGHVGCCRLGRRYLSPVRRRYRHGDFVWLEKQRRVNNVVPVSPDLEGSWAPAGVFGGADVTPGVDLRALRCAPCEYRAADGGGVLQPLATPKDGARHEELQRLSTCHFGSSMGPGQIFPRPDRWPSRFSRGESVGVLLENFTTMVSWRVP